MNATGYAKSRATSAHSKLIRSRGACERCGTTWNLQCAHMVSRRYAATRTDEANGWCLCDVCHQFVDQRQSVFMELVDRTVGRDEYNRLRYKAMEGVHTSEGFWLAEYDRLTRLLREAA